MAEDRLGTQPVLGIDPDVMPYDLPGAIDDEHGRRSYTITQ
jgi:hypothetical protein